MSIKIPTNCLDRSQDALGNPTTNLPGYAHNGAESKELHTDGRIVNAIKITGDGADKILIATTYLNDRPYYRNGPSEDQLMYYAAGIWNYDNVIGGVSSVTTATTSPTPPKTGYAGDKVITVVHNSFWVDDNGNFIAKGYADKRAHENGGGNLWLGCVEINGVPHYKNITQYSLAKAFDTAEDNENKKFFGDNCGTGYAASGFDDGFDDGFGT